MIYVIVLNEQHFAIDKGDDPLTGSDIIDLVNEFNMQNTSITNLVLACIPKNSKDVEHKEKLSNDFKK